MDWTIKRVLGFQVGDDGATVGVRVETASGKKFTLYLERAAILEAVLVLMKSSIAPAPLPGRDARQSEPDDDLPTHYLIPTGAVLAQTDSDPGKRRIRIGTPGGAVFELNVPIDKIDRDT